MKLSYKFFCALIIMFAVISCRKSSFETAEVYPKPPGQLVKFGDAKPVPYIGDQGSVVTYQVSGLEGQKGKFKFFINQTEAEVVETTATTISVKVPASASTGGASILINGEYYFGPTFIVKGKVAISTDFLPSAYRSNGTINGILSASSNNLVLYGSFTNYSNKSSNVNPITGLVSVNYKGEYDGTQFTTLKTGFNAGIADVRILPSGKYLIGGSFTKFDSVDNVRGVTIFTSDRKLDTVTANVINMDEYNRPEDSKIFVASFNGAVYGGFGAVKNVYYDAATDKVIAVGNFTNYLSTFYERSTKNSLRYDEILMSQMVKTNINGAIDSGFHYNYATKRSFLGANGFISGSIKTPTGDILMVGNFTSFNGITANRIVKIKAIDGTVDASFNSGTGADGSIDKIIPANNNKMFIVGNFKNYNGVAANGLVLLNADGSIDNSFMLKELEGGNVNFAGQLSDGKIIISGTFTKYDGIIRTGLAILNANGTMSMDYNRHGLFRGEVNAILEVPNTDLDVTKTIFLVGRFDRFDNTEVGNIVKIVFKN